MAHRGITDRRIEMASEVIQLERQLRLLIEATEKFMEAAGYTCGVYVPRENFEALQDRLETAKAHLS